MLVPAVMAIYTDIRPVGHIRRGSREGRTTQCVGEVMEDMGLLYELLSCFDKKGSRLTPGQALFVRLSSTWHHWNGRNCDIRNGWDSILSALSRNHTVPDDADDKFQNAALSRLAHGSWNLLRQQEELQLHPRKG